MPFIVDVLSVCAKVRLINQYILYSQYKAIRVTQIINKKNCSIYLSKVKKHGNGFLFPGFSSR